MGFELEKRLASELNRLADEANRDDKDAQPRRHVERMKQIAAELQARLLGSVAVDEEPGKRTAVDGTVASAVRRLESAAQRARAFDTLPWQQQAGTFDDYRARALGEVLARLSDHRLKRTTLASAEPAVAARVPGALTRTKSSSSTTAGQALWRVAERRAATLYRHAMDDGEVASEDPIVDEALARCGSGQPLPTPLRKQMESELGISLTRVRVHTDQVAAAAAKAVRADAFTVGEDIFFAESRFSPESRDGQKLLAHELTHVVQAYQGRTSTGTGGFTVSQPGEALEREADAVADRIEERARRPRATRATRGLPRVGGANVAPRARGSSPDITSKPLPAAPVRASRGAQLLRRATDSARDNEAPKKKSDNPDQRGKIPNLHIQRDRAGERSRRDAKKGAEPMRDGAKQISAQVKNVVSGAVTDLKSTAKQVQAKGVGNKAKQLAKQQGSQGKAHAKEAKKAAQSANQAAAQAAKHSGGKSRGAEQQGGGDGAGVGAIQFKPISDWNKYMPAELPGQDEREKKRILGLVKSQINGDRQQSAKLLNQLHKAHLAQAKDVRAMLPGLKGQITAGQNAAIAQVTAAEGAQASAVQAHVAGVTAQVRATATQMVAQINAAHTAAMNAIRDAQQSATQKLQQAQTQALTDIDTAESTQVALVNVQFSQTGIAIRALGTAKAGEARARGDSYPLDYDGDKLEAARKAAREVAAEYARAMPEEAQKAFQQVDAERPKTISDIRKMATDQRKQVRDAFKQCKQTIDDAAEQANKAANEMKTSAVSQVQSTASTTASQLAAHGASQVAGIRQAAAGARAGIQKAGAAAVQSVTTSVNKAAQGLEKGAAGLAKGCKTVETASVEETKQRVTEGMQLLGEAGRSIGQGMQKSAQGAVSGMTQQAQGAAQGMTQTANTAKQTATQMGQGATQAMSQIAQGSSQGLQQLGQNSKKNAEDIAGKGKEAMKGVVDGLKQAYTAASQQLRDGLRGAVDNVRASFDDAVLPQEDKSIAENAKKAADAVKPWWQKALAFVVSIVVAIVVVVVVTALIVTTGPIGAILVGAAAGALGSVLGQMASNLVLGNGLMEGITWQTVAMGAVGGAVGAGFTSAITAGAQRFGATAVTAALKGGTGAGAYAIRTGVGVAGDVVSDAATQLIFTGGYQFSMENLATSLVTNSITSTNRYNTAQENFQGSIRNRTGHIEVGTLNGGGLNLGTSVHGPGSPVTNKPSTAAASSSPQGDAPSTASHAGPGGEAPRPQAQADGARPPAQGDAARPQAQGDGARPQGDAPAQAHGGEAPHTQTGDAPRPQAQDGARPPAQGDAPRPQAQDGARPPAQGDAPRPQADAPTQAQGDAPRPQGDQAAAGDRGGTVTRSDTGDAPTAPRTADSQQGSAPRADGDARQAQGRTTDARTPGDPQAQGPRASGGDVAVHGDDGQPAPHHDAAGDQTPAHGGDADTTPAGPENAVADQLGELGYPNPTRQNADRAANAIESGSMPPPDTIRDTNANQQGLRDLQRVDSDPTLTPESKQNIRRDVAGQLRADEPSGNLPQNVADAQAREQQRVQSQAQEPVAQQQDAVQQQTGGDKPALGPEIKPGTERTTQVHDAFDAMPAYQKQDVARGEISQGARVFDSQEAAATWARDVLQNDVTQLPEHMQQSVHNYTNEKGNKGYDGPTYREMNGVLRADAKGETSSYDSPAVRQDIAQIDEAMARNRLPEAVTVVRGSGHGHLDATTPADLVGTTMQEPGYLSTSLGDNGTVAAFADKEMILHLRVPEGHEAMWVEPVGAFGGGERELLLGRGTSWEVTRAFIGDDGKWHVYGVVGGGGGGGGGRRAPAGATGSTAPSTPAASPTAPSATAPSGGGTSGMMGSFGAMEGRTGGGGARDGGTRGGAAGGDRGAATDRITVQTAHGAGAGGTNRTTVGIGERVTFSTSSAGTWTASGSLSGETTGSGTEYIWQAPSTASTVTIRHSAAGTVTMNVIEPSNIKFTKQNDMAQVPAGAGMYLSFDLEPNTVSWDEVEVKELGGSGAGDATTDGYFTEYRQLTGETLQHSPNENWVGKDQWFDTALIRNKPPIGPAGTTPRWYAGSYSWTIPTMARVVGHGEGARIATVEQRATMEGAPNAGRVTVTKGAVGGANRPSVTQTPEGRVEGADSHPDRLTLDDARALFGGNGYSDGFQQGMARLNEARATDPGTYRVLLQACREMGYQVKVWLKCLNSYSWVMNDSASVVAAGTATSTARSISIDTNETHSVRIPLETVFDLERWTSQASMTITATIEGRIMSISSTFPFWDHESYAELPGSDGRYQIKLAITR